MPKYKIDGRHSNHKAFKRNKQTIITKCNYVTTTRSIRVYHEEIWVMNYNI